MDERIVFNLEDGKSAELYIHASEIINGMNYLMVSNAESTSEEGYVFFVKSIDDKIIDIESQEEMNMVVQAFSAKLGDVEFYMG